MKTTKRRRTIPRKPRLGRRLWIEHLEDRTLLSSSPAHVFAQFSDVLSGPSDTKQINIALDASDFTLPSSGNVLLGFQLKAAAGSSLDPGLVQLQDDDGNPVNPQYASADLAGDAQSLVLAPLAYGSYSLTVSGEDGTSGAFQLDVFLAGDANGDRTVDASDGSLIQSLLGSVPGDGHYRVEADANLDGVIDATDYSYWVQNQGAATTVNPLTVGINLSPAPITLHDGTLATNSRDATVAGTTSPGATVNLQVEDDDPTTTADTSGNFSFPVSLDEGPNTLQVQATDGFGQQQTASLSVTSDDAPPTVDITSPDDGLVTNSNVTIAGQVTDDLTGVASLQAQVDTGPFFNVAFDASGNFSFATTLPLDGSADGTHTVHLQATDGAGNVSDPVDVSFTLDTQPPTVVIATPSPGFLANDNITVTGQVTDNLSGVQTLQAQVDGGGFFPVDFDDSGNFSFDTNLPTDGSADGVHTVQVQATDQAGNVSGVFSVTFTLDTLPPTVVIASPMADAAVNTDVITGQVTDAVSGVASLQARLDDGTYSPVSFDATGHFSFPAGLPLDGSADGDHTVELQATDRAGNVSDNVDVSFTLDTQPPTVTIDSPEQGIVTNTNVTVAGAVDDALSGVASLQGQVDGGPFSNVAFDGDGNFSFVTALRLNGSTDGNHVVNFVATDVAGNTSAPFPFSFTLDTHPPLVTITSPTGMVTTNMNVTITGQATDTLSGVASLQAAVDADPLSDVPFDASGNFSFTTGLALDGSNDGIHNVLFRATNNTGSTFDAFFSFTLLTQPPALPVFALDPTANTGTTANPITTAGLVTLIGHTSPNVAVTLDGPIAQTISSNTGTFQFTGVPLALGDNTFTAQASDAAGSSSFTLTINRQPPTGRQNQVLVWNQAVLNAIQADASDPLVASRAMAMVQAAVFDAVSAIEGTPGYAVQLAAPADASADAAVASAAHTVLSYLYPAQQATFDSLLTTSLAAIPDGQGKTDGISLGQTAGNAIIALRAHDGWNKFVDYVPGSGPGVWVPTAPMFMEALGPQWATMQPWTMTSPSQFRPGGPPALNSQAWADAFNEVKSLGSATSTTRTADQTQIARFWADGSGSLTPPGHWNQIAAQIAQQTGDSLAEDARLFAVLDTTLADAAIVAWDAKYTYNAWRPITAIHNADTAGNSNVQADTGWTPLLVTPPFPEYVSGHSTFSAAAATVLDSFFGNLVNFSTGSATLPGVTRTFTGFDQAAAEAGQSRIYAGIHFQFSNQDGQAAGKSLANYALSFFNIAQDTIPPKITLDNVLPSGASNKNFNLSGQVTDNLSGVASLTVQVDQGNVFSATFNGAGSFTVPTSFPLDGSGDGKHTITLVAKDFAGNASAPVVFSFVLDTKAPVISITTPGNNSNLAPGAILTGSVTTTGAALTGLNYAFDAGTSMPISFDASGAFNATLDLSKLAMGSHALTVTAQDAAGNSASTTLNLTQPALIPLTITSVTPTNGADQVGVTFRPKVVFSRPIDPSTLTSNDFFASDSTGTKLAASIVPSQDDTFAWLFFTNPMPGASTITLTVDGSGIKASDGALLDAAGNGVPGSKLTFTFATVNQATVPGTSLTGILADPGPDLKPGTFDDVRPGPDGVLMTADDIYLNPIAGAKVFILGLENQAVFTDAQGRFNFDSVPTGDIKLDIDGRTATNAPAGMYFPEMVMDLTIKPGQVNSVMGSMGSRQETTALANVLGVYLPRLQNTILQAVSNTQPTMIGVPVQAAPDLTPQQQQMLTLEVQPNTAMGADGKPMSNVQVGVSTVPTVLIRNMLPTGVKEPRITITVQAPGVATFSTPITVTYPNVDNDPPGTKLNFISFDHTTGRLEIEGTATVSADGQSVVTDPGVGITHPGWHLVQVGSPTTNGMPCTDSMCVHADGHLGDVIRVDLSGTVALSEKSAADSNFRNLHVTGGKLAVDDNGNPLSDGGLPFSQTGIFYVMPDISQPATYPSPAPMGSTVITGSFEADLVRLNGERDPKTGVIRIDVPPQSPAFTNITLDGSVGQNGDNNRLDVYKVQQRLRFLNFRGFKATPSGPSPQVETNGNGKDPVLIQAINLLEATTQPDGKGNPGNPVVASATVDGTVDVNGSALKWLNAANAPYWVQAPGSYVDANSINYENWATNWTLDIVASAIGRDSSIQGHITSLTEYPDFPLPNGSHQEHKAGNDIDVGFGANTPENTGNFPSTYTLDQMIAGLGSNERRVLSQIRAMVAAAGDRFVEVLVGGAPRKNGTDPQPTFPGLRQVLTALGISNRNVRGHDTHFHVSVTPMIDPPLPQVSAGVTTSISTAAGFGTDPRVYYRIVLANGFEIAGQLSPNQSLSTVLPPNTDYTLSAYQPSSNRSAVFHGHSNASGLLTDLGPIILYQFGGADSTGDGLPDIARYVIGLKVGVRSFAGDGIDDAAKLAEGLDPLDGRAFPTGVIATLPTSGSVQKIAVDGNTIYAAGSGGLTVVDGTQFSNPITLGSLALPGSATGIGVDGNLKIAAVATGSALQLVDVSNGKTPKLLQSVPVAASQVVVADGIAYAASGTSLSQVDLLTGSVIQTLTLPGSNSVTGLAREGTFLYTMDTGRVLRAIDISGPLMITRGSLTLPDGGSSLFVGNGIAYAAARQKSGSTGAGGFATADVSNPDSLTLISAAGFNFGAAGTAPGTAIAANGSGLAVLVGNNFGQNQLFVMDVSNPANTAFRDVLINLSAASGGAADVAISRGIAYVGEGDRIEVVNYLPFDNKGVPPTATISTSAADVDLLTPGLQVFEGSTLPVQANVSDDVQVRDVELLVNGQPVRDAVSFPFDFFAIAPSIAQSGSTFTLQVRATDTGGNVGLSNVITIGLVSDTSPPTISNFDPANGSSPLEGLQAVKILFSKPIAAATVNATNFQLQDGGGNTIAPTNIELRDSDKLVEITYAPLVAGTYQVVINAPGVTDRVGNALSSGLVTDSFTLTPRATLTTTVADADPNTPGIQVLEGTTLPLTVTVATGVSVQSVTLLANGQVAGTATSAPFQFSVVSPILASGTTSVTLQAQVTDTGGFTTATNTIVIGLLRDTTPPTIVGTDPANGGSGFQGLQAVKVVFSKSLAMASVTAANFQLTAAGPDGVFGDSDDIPITISAIAFLNDDSVVQLTTPALAAGNYQLQVQETGITDRPGNPLGTGIFISTFQLAAVVPITITFDAGSGFPHSYTESGLTVVSGQDHIHLGDWSGDGSPDLMNHTDCCSTPYTFTYKSGAPFTVLSMDVHKSASAAFSPGIFTSSSGAVVIASSLGLFTFPAEGWTNITSFRWDQQSGGFSESVIDNLKILVPAGQPQIFAGSPKAPTEDTAGLNLEQLQPAIAQGITNLAKAGFDVSPLDNVTVYVVNLPGSLLGLTYQHSIWIDQNAAGYGWYTGVSPSSTSAFTQVTGANELQAAPGSPAYAHVDLLTVVTHELGHVLGFASIDAGILGHDWMTATLGTGVRRYPDAAGTSELPLGSDVRILTTRYQSPTGGAGALGSVSHVVAALLAPPSGPAPHEVALASEPFLDEVVASFSSKPDGQALAVPVPVFDRLSQQPTAPLPLNNAQGPRLIWEQRPGKPTYYSASKEAIDLVLSRLEGPGLEDALLNQVALGQRKTHKGS